MMRRARSAPCRSATGLATARRHGGAVGDEQVRHVVPLVELVEHRSLGILTRAGRAYLMDAEARGARLIVHGRHETAGRVHHRLAVLDNRLGHLLLVRPVRTIDLHDRNNPLINLVRARRHAALRIGQHLAKARDISKPSPELATTGTKRSSAP